MNVIWLNFYGKIPPGLMREKRQESGLSLPVIRSDESVGRVLEDIAKAPMVRSATVVRL